MATSLPYGERHPSLCGLAPGCVSLIFHMTGQLEGTGIQRHLCKRGQLAMKEHDSLRPKEPQNVTSMLDECDCADCVVFSVSNAGLSSKPGWGSFRRKWQGILLRYTPCNTKGGNTVPVISSSVEDLTKPSRPNLLHSPLPLTAAGSNDCSLNAGPCHACAPVECRLLAMYTAAILFHLASCKSIASSTCTSDGVDISSFPHIVAGSHLFLRPLHFPSQVILAFKCVCCIKQSSTTSLVKKGPS